LAGCEILLESSDVSRQHAQVFPLQGQYYIKDLGSRNGTFLNGERLRREEPQVLRDKDEITICSTVFVFHHAADDEELAAATPPLVFESDSGGTTAIMSKVEMSSQALGTLPQLNPQAKIKALLEISQSLGKSLGLDQVLRKLLDGLFRIFVQAERGFVILSDSRTGKLLPRVVKYRRPEAADTIRVSRTILQKVMEAREAILSADATSDSRFRQAESILDFHIRSLMCAPLVNSDGVVLGAIQIDTLDQRNRFTRDDLELLAAVAYQASFAVENAQLHEAALRQQALARELALAHQVQRNLLPAAPPALDEYEFFAFYEAASELGGDYYDYVPLPGQRWAIVVADVSGKGISAALLMARLSADTRFCLASEATPAAALCRLNRLCCQSRWEDRFVTLTVCVLDPRRHEVTVANAGHPSPLWRSREGRVIPLAEAETQIPLGIDSQVSYSQCAITLAPGDDVVLYTDGITEALDPTDAPYELSRLVAQLQHGAARVEELGKQVLDDVRAFVGPRRQSDDMCLVVFGRKV
jgi:serine phosphatase RsbU (regulator of sigma subunit)